MLLRINTRLMSIAIAALITVSIIAYLVLFSNLFQQAPQQQLPTDIQYALEYFNAANSNSTILVPSQYYQLAKQFEINGNSIIENDSEYANILLKNASYPGVNYVLIDMAQLNSLADLYNETGSILSFGITEFPINYTIENLTSGAKNCAVFRNSTREFAQCDLYVANARYGPISLAIFPGNDTLYTVKGAVFYSSNICSKSNMTYLPSSVATNGTYSKDGIMFVYENVASFYIPGKLLSTFYGREMFMPPSIAVNVTASYGEARVIRLQ